MTTIALRKYNELINSLIDQEKYQEAISHCTTVLNSHPKYIDTYKSLGRALLENKQYDEAENLFSKILSVFPEDFSAHAALSEINEEKRELDRAIWHMERAFETQPSNLNVQEEMRRLIGRRDGTPPAKVRLTRGALIRMYAKGDLYQQAIAETQSAIEADADRVDLKVLLARFYHATGANAEAASTCVEILSSAPYCYEANRILFDISSHSNDYTFDPIYKERLSELDPYYRFIEDSKEDVKSIPDEKVILEVLDIISDQPDTSIEQDWAQKIGISWQEEVEVSAKEAFPIHGFSDDEVLDNEIPLASSQATPFIEGTTEVTSELDGESSESREDSIPDWIAKAGWIRATDEEVPPTPIEVSSSDLVAESNVQPAEPANDLPDWLKTLNPEQFDSPEVLTPTGESADLQTEIPPLTPDMLNEILMDDNLTVNEVLSKSVDEVTVAPEEFKSELTASIQEESSTDETIPDLPDWLKDLDTGEINVPEGAAIAAENETVFVQEARSELPDFIDELSSTDLLSSDDLLMEAEETYEATLPTTTIKEDIVELEPIESAAEKVEFQTPVIESVEKTEVKPAVPSWVSKILTSSAAAAPLFSTTSTTPEVNPVVIQKGESTIPELINDIPEIESGEGAISSEETRELETWLSEINPDESLPIDLNIKADTTIDEEASSPLISFDSLVEPLTIEESIEVGTEMINEPADFEEELADSSHLQDRLSSMLGIEPTPETHPLSEVSLPISEETLSIPEEQIAATGLREKLTQLLRTGEYSSFLSTISTEDLPGETADEVIYEINEELRSKPDTFELWQSLGDVHSKKDNLNDALSAYKEAEKYLFQ